MPHSTISDIQFLAGGGEMGKLTREKDWSQTPLGTPDTWPQSLRTALSILLNSKFPMFLFWGTELICFYNDAYRPSLGKDGKHPSILGMKAKDAWPETWEIIQPMINQVLTTGNATWNENTLIPIYRNNRLEDAYWTFSYSPVNDETGKPAGVFVTCSETTDNINNLRQLEQINKRFTNSIRQAPVAMCVFKGENLIVEIANDQMLQLWEKKAEDVIGKPYFQAVPETQGQGLEAMLENVYKTGETFSANESPVNLMRNGRIEKTYLDFVCEAIKESDGSISGIIGTAIDVTVHKNSLETIEKMATHLKLATDSAKVGTWSLDMATQMLDWSALHKKLWGYDESRTDLSYEDWHRLILPEDKELAFKKVEESRLANSFYEVEYRIKKADDDDIRTIRSVGKYYYDDNGEAKTLTGISIDITEQKETEQKVRAVVENAPFAIAVYTGEEMRVELANQAIIDIWGKGNDVIGKTFTEILPELKGQSVFEQIKEVYLTGKSFHTQNTPLELVVNGKKDTYYFNYDFTPLYDLSGKIYGVMNTGIDLTDLNNAKRQIEESNLRFRNTVKQAPVAIAIFRGRDYVAEMANEAYQELVDRKENELIGFPLFDALPEVKEIVKPLLDGVFDTGIPFHGNEIAAPIKRNGEIGIYNFDVLYHPLKEEDGTISGIIVTATEVTEKVEARKRTEQNEQKLSIIIEASELGTWELNVKTSETKYSQRYLEIIGGYTQPVVLTHDALLKHLHPEDMEIRNKGFRDALATGFLKYEARVIWKDNTIHWMEGKGKVFYDDNGEPEKMIGTIRDITQDKTQQLQLIESEKKFRLLSDSMPQQIWTSDTEGNLNYYNKSVVEYTGMSLQEIAKKGWIDIVHPDDREENINKWMHSINSGKDFLLEHRFRRHDGKYRWQLSRAIPQKDQYGNIKMWVGTSTDVHDQKTFADELERQVKERTKELNLLNEILQQSEERYHLMVDEVQDYAIIYLNRNGIVENWNKGAENIKGYTAEEIVGKSFENFYTAEERKGKLPQYLLNQAAKLGRYGQEGWRIRKDGTSFWASVIITAIHNNDGEVIGFSKVTHDLTAKKEADDKLKLNAAELEFKNQELQKMNKELQSFAYISSHDLQEPLRKIQTFANMIIDKEFDNLSDNGKDKFKRMQNAAQRMQTLINDLLAYSRTNNQEIKLTKTNINQIIEDVKEDLKEELQQKNATVEHDTMGYEIDIVPFQFHQLLFNLVSNSIKFSLPHIPPVIKIKSEIKKGKDLLNKNLINDLDYCHITFSDNGIGFDQQYSEKIFEVFQRLHGKETYQGTGIGLAIVKKIIDNHKGIITAKGELGVGATFDIFIPVKS